LSDVVIFMKFTMQLQYLGDVDGMIC